MLLAVKRAVIAYVAMAKKDAGHNIHRVFSRCYMQLDYTPNEHNAMQPAILYDRKSKKTVIRTESINVATLLLATH
jgi:hypothetical protein